MRNTPAPLKNIRTDEELTDEQRRILSEPHVKELQQLAGNINWIVSSTRVDAYYAHWICTTQCILNSIVYCVEFVLLYRALVSATHNIMGDV